MKKILPVFFENLLDGFQEELRARRVRNVVGLDIIRLTSDDVVSFYLQTEFSTKNDNANLVPGEFSFAMAMDQTVREHPGFKMIQFADDLKTTRKVPVRKKFDVQTYETEFLQSYLSPSWRLESIHSSFAVSHPPPLATTTLGATRPCPGGMLISVGSSRRKSTLTTTLGYGGPGGGIPAMQTPKVIGCNHALCNNSLRGKSFYQLPVQSPPNRIGVGLKYHKIKFEPSNPGSVSNCVYLNEFDVCWGDPEPNQTSRDILQIGDPQPIRAPSLDDTKVDLYGAMSGLVEEIGVVSIHYRYFSKSKASMYSGWKRAIKLDKHVTTDGDCGAAYVSRFDGAVIGIHRAFNDHASVGAPLI